MTPDEYRATLERLGISQARLAQILETDAGTVSRWARGLRPIPRSVELLLRLDLATLDRISAP